MPSPGPQADGYREAAGSRRLWNTLEAAVTTSTNRLTAGRVSLARQATHSAAGETPVLRTKASPGRA